MGINPVNDGVDEKCGIVNKADECHHAVSFICFELAVNEIFKYLTFLIEAFNQILFSFKYLYMMKLRLNSS